MLITVTVIIANIGLSIMQNMAACETPYVSYKYQCNHTPIFGYRVVKIYGQKFLFSLCVHPVEICSTAIDGEVMCVRPNIYVRNY